MDNRISRAREYMDRQLQTRLPRAYNIQRSLPTAITESAMGERRIAQRDVSPAAPCQIGAQQGEDK